MSTQAHPYRAARPQPGRTYWVHDDCLVVLKEEADLPDRCVVCNEPADGYRKIEKIDCLGAQSERGGIEVALPLCCEHRHHLGSIRFVSRFLTAALSVASLVLALNQLVMVSFVLMLLALVGFTLGPYWLRYFKVVRIEERRVWLRVGEAFVDSIRFEDMALKLMCDDATDRRQCSG